MSGVKKGKRANTSFDQHLFDKYDISKLGFLTDPSTISDVLPSNFAEYQNVVDAIAHPDGIFFRSLVHELKCGKPHSYYVDKVNSLTYNQKKQIYSLFTFIAQKYVRCMGVVDKSEQVTEIPYEIGLVWNECAKEFSLPCVTSYGAVILYNCKYTPEGNLTSRHAISGTSDELHFYKIHMDIEKFGGKLLKDMYYYKGQNDSKENIMNLLSNVSNTVKHITKTMKGMYDGCDPTVFWSVVRLYLGGYNKDSNLPNGLGVTDTNLRFKFGGGSAAQSTLIQAIDIVLNIPHDSAHGVKFLAEQRKYMPIKHQQFLIDLEKKYNSIPLKEIIEIIDDNELTVQYNKTIDSLRTFRVAHYNIVHKYVNQFIETKQWYIKLLESLFGQYGKTTIYVKTMIRNLKKNINKNNLHGSNGSGGLPTEQLQDYIDDTENRKIVKNNEFVINPITNAIINKWWLWPILFFIVCNIFKFTC